MVEHLAAIFDERRAPMVGLAATWVTVGLILLAAVVQPDGFVFDFFDLRFLAGVAVFLAVVATMSYRRERAAAGEAERADGRSAGLGEVSEGEVGNARVDEEHPPDFPI